MTLLFIDGFDHYGLDEGNMTDGAYAEVNTGGFSLSTANPRTGTHAMRRSSGAVNTSPVRRVLGGAKTTVAQAVALYMSQLPNGNDEYAVYDFRDTANGIQLSILVQSTGIMEVKRGTVAGGVSLGATSVPVIVAEAYQHIETVATFDNTTGAVEIRVNGVTVLSLTSVDTVATSNVECSQVSILGGGNSGSFSHGVNSDYDDYFCYDDTGSFNNTFIGDRKVLTLFPDADTAVDDWTRNTGADNFDTINEADPDDDTTYIFATPGGSPNIISEFDFEDLPEGISSISGIVLVNRAKKTDAGTANFQASIVSATNEIAGTDNPMTEAYTYRHDVIEVDPDTSAPFTPTALDAAKLKLDRTD